MKKIFAIDPKYHGHGPVVFSWHPECHYLATAGTQGDSHVVYIWDRYGQVVDEIALPPVSYCRAMEWDKEGDVLAILASETSVVPLWERASKKTTQLDTNLKDLTWLKWSRTGPQLAVGTAKGALLIYNKKTMKKIPIMGKHSRRISCGGWNLENKLALGSDDKTLSISNQEGDTLDTTSCKYEPVEIQFSEMKVDEKRTSKENTVSINMGRRTILLYNLNDKENPIELAFQARYGQIVSFRWFGDGYIVIGFGSGFLVVISTHMKEIGEELFSAKFHEESLTDIALSPPVAGLAGGAAVQRCATAGDNSVKIFDMAEYKEIAADRIMLDPGQRTDRLQDGHILSVSTTGGHVYSFMARVPVVHAACDSKYAHLTSLRELAVGDAAAPEEPLAKMAISIEPTLLGLGPSHVAVGMNNTVYYYRIDRGQKGGQALASQREYLGSVDQVRLNATHAAALVDGRIYLHPIEGAGAGGGDAESKTFPEGDGEVGIKCMALTQNFLIYGTARGTIHYFYLADWAQVNEYRHEMGVQRIAANATGTRLIFQDDSMAAYLYNPVNDLKLAVPGFPATTALALWDAVDANVFVGIDGKEFITYVYAGTTMTGPDVIRVGATKRPVGFAPVLLCAGVLTCQVPNGAMQPLTLATHDAIVQRSGRVAPEARRNAVGQNLALRRFKEAYLAAREVDDREIWRKLGQEAMRCLDIDTAIRAFRHLGDAAMVMSLQKILPIEDKNLLSGHVQLLFGEYQVAQDLFLSSSRPATALEMQRDLRQWDQALKLATTLAPAETPFICREYAQMLEIKGEYATALQMFERGRVSDASAAAKEHNAACAGGVARMNLRLGNISVGVQMAERSGSKQLCRDCAQILEGMKQLQEAARLYVKGEMFDKAASIFIQNKNFRDAAPLMARISTPKLHSQFAKAKEATGEYAEAAAAYERAGDVDNVIRINLEKLSNPEKASAMVRQSKSPEGALLLAKFCQGHGNFRGAIEFLLIAKKSEEAFEMAQAHDEMDTYADLVAAALRPDDRDAKKDELLRIAQYYESKQAHGPAGKFYAACEQYGKALKLFLQCGEKELDGAIDVVGKANNDMLTHTLIDYLMGETDGVPKDPNYIFRLYMALKNYQQAAKTAIIIARQEQELGNYKMAHQMLYDTYRELESQKIKVSQELTRNLCLLHSYVLVKSLVKQDDHLAAARMLIRVAKSISKFPAHVVPILTSTVIECQRSGLKRSAFEYASLLMRPEYRKGIAEAYKRKIEAIVRKPDREEEPDEELSPCPFCRFELPHTQLDCPSCKNWIPYCIATGRHMLLEEWSQCPSCRFPALYSPFLKLVETEKTCPMCNQEVSLSAVSRAENPAALLRKATEAAAQDDPEGAPAAP